MEIKGIIIEILPSQTGEGKNGTWEKRAFVLQTNDKFPKTVAIDIWDNKIETPKVSDNVIANINIESKEFNNKWFTNIQTWKLEIDGGLTNQKPSKSNKESDPIGEGIEPEELPF